MKNLIYMLTLLAFATFSHAKRFDPSPFEIVALNSPVKDAEARFLLKTPSGFSIDKVSYFVFGPKIFNFKTGLHKDINLVNGANGPELRIPVKNWKSGFYRLYVKVKDKKKKEHTYRSALRDYVAFSVDKLVLPPPPKPDQNATLLGVDSDADGIRDDVQLWIESNYASSGEVRLAVRQLAQAQQLALASKDNRANSIQASLLVLAAGDCLVETQTLKGTPLNEIFQLKEKIKLLHRNTKERIEAGFKLNENFSGNSYSLLSKEEACNF